MVVKYFKLKLSKKALINVSFPAPGACECTIEKYIAGHEDKKDSKSDCASMSACLATLYSMVSQFLSGTIGNIKSSGMASITGFIYTNGHFGFTIQCEGKNSSIRKVLTIIKTIINKLTAGNKTYKKFTSSDEGFDWCLSKIATGVKNVHISISKPGKELTPEVKKAVDKIVDDIGLEAKGGSEPADAKTKHQHCSNCLKVDGPIDRFMVGSYLSSNNVVFTYSGDCINVTTGNQKIETIKGKYSDKDRINAFVQKKINVKKNKAIIGEIIYTQLSSSGKILASEVDTVFKNGFDNEGTLSNMIVKAFK
jgi:hypothetical protein